MSTERFSKKTLAKYVFGRMDTLRTAHGFDPGNGYAQVQNSSVSVTVAYGEYCALKKMVSEFELHGLDRS